jgi:hypothetical protein
VILKSVFLIKEQYVSFWIGGMWWNGMERYIIRFHCLDLQKINGMEWNQFHPIPLNPSIFHSSQFGVYPMEWNTLIIQFQFCPYSSTLAFASLHSLFLLHCSCFNSSTLLQLDVDIHTRLRHHF